MKYGSNNVVYFDESGFYSNPIRMYGWAAKGKKIYGNISGQRKRKTNLIMAQKGREWLAPMLFEGSCTAELVNSWLEKMLLPELTSPSIVVMDNAAFHNKEAIRQILAKYGHILLPLPSYSPDFNPIEQSFAILKQRRLSTTPPTSLESLLSCCF